MKNDKVVPPKILEAQKWVAAQTGDVKAISKNPETDPVILAVIAAKSPFNILTNIINNPASHEKVLQYVFKNNCVTKNEQDILRTQILKNPSLSSAFLMNRYFEGELSYIQTCLLISHPNIPVKMVIDMVPYKPLNEKDQVTELSMAALLNPTTPVDYVFYGLQFLEGRPEKEEVWEARYSELVQFCETKFGVNITDWSEEWVYELIKPNRND